MPNKTRVELPTEQPVSAAPCVASHPPNPLTALPEGALVIVSCTRTKIWAAYPGAARFVPACQAYRGSSFLAFMRHLEQQMREGGPDIRWLILSAKYGYIEPWQPVDNYDVTFSDPKTGPISEETLYGQVMYQTRWPDRKRMRDFRAIMYSGTDIYGERIGLSFRDTDAVIAAIHV
ncbi:MAG: hypothetical protein Q8P50_17325 [Bacillota bacterium]|nr:hypothetical protein [Bacillota bacterium]